MMTAKEFKAAADAIRNLRFIQAAALVASGVNNDKPARQYMAELQRLQTKLEEKAMQGDGNGNVE